MKSFRQKIEERQRIIDAERKLAKETVDRLAYIKKRDDLLELEQDKKPVRKLSDYNKLQNHLI